ncbi:ABC transporter ATP-binding protein [Halorussus marinus]|uniref:ABC transporter ATP-binding protein n=1 Tax=Halorussus marinus TaxID=2505976 RepID=UPI00109301E3|nr:ABC transporter ATP-binding protein [Halorussus marinus]
MTDDPPLLDVEDLTVHFHTEQGTVRAVDGVSFRVGEREAFGLVGESGAGKSVTAMSILKLIQTPPGEIVDGSVRFRGEDVLSMSGPELQRVRGNEIGMIFQDPEQSLNPVHTVGRQVAEPVRIHRDVSDEEAWDRAVEMLELVGIPDPGERATEYPHQFSGGMQQRAMIAMALANNPSLLIADEPTTSLDVTIEATILDLIDRLQEDHDMSVVLITHDLSVISEVCDRVGVMYAGRMAEVAPVERIYDAPRHPYTYGLVNSIPSAREKTDSLASIEGQMPSGIDPPSGCRFHPRCPAAMADCDRHHPEEVERDGGRVACHLYPEPRDEPGSAAEVDPDPELIGRLTGGDDRAADRRRGGAGE